MSSSMLQYTYLPFYSSAAAFTVLSFLVYLTFIALSNCVRYIRFGVTNQSDFYTEEGTLKVESLLLSVFGGELLFGCLISFFYIQQKSFQFGMMQAINTSLLSLVALLLLMAAYFGFGVHVRFQQTVGAFIVIVGSLCMYIALSHSKHLSDDSPGAVSTDSGTIATSVLGLNAIAALCFSGVFIILKVNHQRSQIKWHSGIMLISFIMICN